MKKMLFAAIAMVAFTLSANAANEVVESVEFSREEDCSKIWLLSYTLNRSEGKSIEDSRAEADNAKKNCIDGSGVNGPVTGEDKGSKTTTGPKANVISPR